jgi:Arc/MetJ family transcription regulator
MRTNIDTDDALMDKAMQSSGAEAKKVVVEEALQLLARVKAQASIRKLRGTILWEGDLHEMRRKRFVD